MEQLKLDDFTKYRFLSNVRFAEDGRNAAFILHSSNLEKNGYDTDIWLYDIGCGQARQLTAMGDSGSFLWLDNETLLFSSKRERKESKPAEPETDFFKIRIDGGEAVKAFTIPAKVGGVKALSNGKYVISAEFDNTAPDFSGMDKAAKAEALDRRKEEQDYTVLDEIPFWGNGEGVINKKRNRLWLFDPAGGKLVPITDKLFSAGSWELNESRDKLLYTGTEYSDRCPLTAGLYCYDIPTGKTETLLPDGRYNLYSAHFFAGRILLLGTESRRYGLNENPCLYWYDEGKGVCLFSDPDLSFGSSVGSDCRLGGGQDFSLGKDEIYGVVTDRSCSRLARIGLDGTISYRTAAEGSVDCFDQKNGVCLFIGMRGQSLQELYSLDLSSGEEKRLTAFNGSVHKNCYTAVPQPLSFTNKDGVVIDGWVLLPNAYASAPDTAAASDGNKKYPAILDIHGGPKTVYGTVYYHEMQFWANQGYFVFYCNPRGGDGRGNAFADIRGKYGTIDYTDLMEFTDQVLARYPAIDPQRVGVTGGSYGGFMTNWIIGHTQRFAAAASQRSISNWVSMAYTTDIGYYFAPDQTAGTAWNGVEKMWEQSPLKYADRCSTPTLFIHSDEDYRCWQAEAFQMFTALKVHGVDARLCLFKGENHELSRSGKPKHRIRRLAEITNWFEKYLGDIRSEAKL